MVIIPVFSKRSEHPMSQGSTAAQRHSRGTVLVLCPSSVKELEKKSV
jgi:hypothetical protein